MSNNNLPTVSSNAFIELRFAFKKKRLDCYLTRTNQNMHDIRYKLSMGIKGTELQAIIDKAVPPNLQLSQEPKAADYNIDYSLK
jgi:hypothetical protein